MEKQKSVFIIGGGVSGLGMAVQLQRKLGHRNFTLFEKSDNIGGTWWHNRYPSCACDIPSHLYSYSFAMKPDWTTTYPGRDELHQYFFSVAEQYDIIRRCEFAMMCLSMSWNEAKAKWICSFKNSTTGETTTREADIVVSAVGTLDRPWTPQIEGGESFTGEAFHSARWDHSIATQNKRVVVLGNGASATQFLPELLRNVGPRGSVTQIVRSSHWWTKRGNPTYSMAFKAVMRYVPFAQRLYRGILAWELDTVFYSFNMNAAGAAMRNQYRSNTMKYIEEEAPAEYKKILVPEYEPGCKRRVNTLDYFKTLHAPNMHLAKERVTKIVDGSVHTAEGKNYPADVLIYATGFMTQRWLFPIDVKGIAGRDLQSTWEAAGGAEAYKGTVVTDFPNLFILYGPNAATGQHSVIFHSECQINYSCRLLRPVLRGRADSIMVKAQAQERDLAWVHGKVKNLVFNSGCASWWMDPKTGKNTFIYPDPMFKYWLRTIFPIWKDFDLRKNGTVAQGKGSFGPRTQLCVLATAASVMTFFLMNRQATVTSTHLLQTVAAPFREILASFRGMF